MKYIAALIVAVCLTFGSSLAFAATATYMDDPADDILDITSLVPVTAPDGVKIFIFNGTLGSNYTMQFLVDEAPEIVVSTGSRITTDWTYDETTHVVTVQLNYTGFIQQIADELFQGQQSFSVGMSWLEADDDLGTALTGTWMSTNIFDWSIEDEQTGRIGFEVSGPEGTTGFFTMSLPASIFTALVPGRTLTIADLAIFNDGDQASVNVRSSERGGALIDINVRFTGDSNSVRLVSGRARTESKALTTGRKLALSLASNDYSVRKNQSVNLYGWLGNRARGKAVSILAKRPGQTSYRTIARVTSGSNGAYRRSVLLSRSGTYRFRTKYMNGTRAVYSPIKNVSVR